MRLLRKTIKVLAGHDLFCARGGDRAGMRWPLVQNIVEKIRAAR
jgi:hypothetical protein